MILRFVLFGCLLTMSTQHSKKPKITTKYRNTVGWMHGMCKDEIQTLQPDFQPHMFFNGSWYLSQSMGTLVSSFYRKCESFTAEMSDPTGQINITLYAYFPIFFISFKENVVIPPGNNRIPTYRLDGRLFFENPISILATDYDNYALIYSCAPKAMGLISESAYVFRRNKTDKSDWKVVREAAWNNGLMYEDFSWHDEDNC